MEGETVVAPAVEHVGALFSATALRKARDWLDAAFGRSSAGPIVRLGLWIALHLCGVVVLLRALTLLLPPGLPTPNSLSAIRC